MESYEARSPELFTKVVEIIKRDFLPIIERHAISGSAVINSEDETLGDGDALAMLIDIFSERGYFAIVDVNRQDVPESIDPKTFKINRIKKVYRVRVRFKGSAIRRGR